MKNRSFRRWLTLVLVLAMLLGILPAVAAADASLSDYAPAGTTNLAVGATLTVSNGTHNAMGQENSYEMPSEHWSKDFVHDGVLDGQGFSTNPYDSEPDASVQVVLTFDLGRRCSVSKFGVFARAGAIFPTDYQIETSLDGEMWSVAAEQTGAPKDPAEPYFYELSYLSVYPYPIGVIAPGCEVRDDGEGAYIANIDETAVEPVFTAELLQSTVLDAGNGYLSHPYLTCGPYKLVSYDRESGTVEFAINEFYVGNYEGVRPVIDTVTLVPVLPQDMKEKLESGEIDLLNKVVDGDVVNSMRPMLSEGYSLLNYARLGYGFCAFACEQGPQQFKAVRQAIDYCFDADSFVRDALKGYGVTVNGYYGLGQWMTLAAMGTIRPEGITPKEEEVWDALNLDELNPYTLDLGKAKALLEEDGWTLNENREPFDETRDAVRCKDVDGELMRLSLDFAQVKDNDFAQLVVDQFSETLPQVGIELVVHEVSFNEMLSDYYREDGERLYDMNFMATNFVSTFDPFMTFTDDPDLVGAMNTSGMTDEQLIDMTWDMHKTEPYDVLTYEQKWIEFQKYYNELLPTMPIYSNVYFDFHTNWLQNYYAGSEINWPEAVLYAYIAEPVETAPDEAQSGLDLDDDMEIDGGNDFGDDDVEIIE